MRRITLALLFIGALFLSACGGGGDSTPEPQVVIPTEEDIPPERATFEATFESILNPPAQPTVAGVSSTQEGALEVALPGTLVASATEDPDAGLIFDKVTFSLQGGGNDAALSIEILQDGTLIRDGVASVLPADAVIELDNMLDTLNYFGIQGTYLGPARDSSIYRYTITVLRGEMERTINAEDGYMPTELQALFAKIVSLGAPVRP